MLYLAYERQFHAMQIATIAGSSVLRALTPWDTVSGRPLRYAAAASAILARAGLTHERPDFGIAAVTVGNREVPVTEEAACATPFGTLVHFRKDVVTAQPRMLLVAPLSGHFATLLRNMVRTLLVDHDVFITDWHNARDIPVVDGAFGFDDYVDHLIRFLDVIGPGVHVLGVCQPCVQVLAAAALMAEERHSPPLICAHDEFIPVRSAIPTASASMRSSASRCAAPRYPIAAPILARRTAVILSTMMSDARQRPFSASGATARR
jgi:polyhydroxyalkanoate depolymerase